MKALALALVLLTMGDVALDHGAGVAMVGRAAKTFALNFKQSLADSFFAA